MELLITGALKKDDELFYSIEKMGHHITYIQDETKPLDIDLSIYEGVICNSLFINNSIETFTSLKYIQLTSMGLDRVNLDYIKEHNITLHNAKDIYAIPISEYVLCGVLQLYKQSKYFYNNQLKHEWIKNRELLELNNKTVTILGCGNIGIQCAKRFKAFNTKVIGIDIKQIQNEYFDYIYPLQELNNYIPKTDILVLSLPLNKDTYHIINKDRLNLLNNNVILVNVSRGSLIDEQALIETIPHIKGAVLDVFEQEPLDTNSPLYNLDNVIITPHNSYISEGNEQRLHKVILENLSNELVK